jgi:hypothetical protein
MTIKLEVIKGAWPFDPFHDAAPCHAPDVVYFPAPGGKGGKGGKGYLFRAETSKGLRAILQTSAELWYLRNSVSPALAQVIKGRLRWLGCTVGPLQAPEAPCRVPGPIPR